MQTIHVNSCNGKKLQQCKYAGAGGANLPPPPRCLRTSSNFRCRPEVTENGKILSK